MSMRLPPGPRPVPRIGNLVGLLRDPLEFLTQLARDHGDVVTFRLGRAPVVFIKDSALSMGRARPKLRPE